MSEIDEDIKLLLVESRSVHVKFIEQLLKISPFEINFEWVTMLAEAVDLLKEQQYDIVLVNVMLGDAGGHEVVQQLMTQCTTVPIITMMENDSIRLSTEMLSHGAQDHIALGDVSINTLSKCIMNAIEREKLTQHLKGQSMKDDMTQLFNRRGFRTLAEQQLRVSERTHRASSFLFVDMDNLKVINDTQGHAVGDIALKDVARILNEGSAQVSTSSVALIAYSPVL